MLKGKKTVMGFETYENEATLNTHVDAETKQTKIRVSRLQHHAR